MTLIHNTYTHKHKNTHSPASVCRSRSMMHQVSTDAIMPHFPEPSLAPAQGLLSDPPPAPRLPLPLAANQVPPVMSGFLPPAPPSQLSSSDLVTPPQASSPNLLPPPLHHLYNRSYDTGFYEPDWRGTEEPASFTFTCQNQAMGQLNFQHQSQFANSLALHYQPNMENPSGGSYSTHTGWYQQGAGHDPWRPSTLGQLHCSPEASAPDSLPSAPPTQRWSCLDSLDSSAAAEEPFSSQFYYNGQPFCSPTTPGLSPHCPQSQNISSPQMQHRDERLDLLTQLGGDFDSFALLPDLQPTSSQHLLPILEQTELLATTGTSGTSNNCSSQQAGCKQDVSSPAHSVGWTAKGGEGVGARAGSGKSGWSFAAPTQPKNSSEPPNNSRLLCVVCGRQFRSLPALNGHMRSHSSGTRNAAWSPHNKIADPSQLSRATSPDQPAVCRGRQRRRSSRPPPAPPACALLYCSLLRCCSLQGGQGRAGADPDSDAGAEVKAAHYTPPPMLCPIRAGTGLYCNLASRRQQRVQTVRLQNSDGFLEVASHPPETLTAKTTKPVINEGRDFQADIPPLQQRQDVDSDSHNALLLWTVQDHLELPDTQLRIEALLMMAHSSVVPGGGASPETTLKILSECRGDFLLTAEKLLSPAVDTSKETLAKSSSWSPAETRLLLRSLQLHGKDFSRVQKDVQTKSLSQCVEFYYQSKKKLNLSVRTPAGPSPKLPATIGKRPAKCP